MTETKTEYTWYYTDKHNGNYGVSQKDGTLRDFYLQLVGDRAKDYLCGWGCYGESLATYQYNNLSEDEKKKYVRIVTPERYLYYHKEDEFTIMDGVDEKIRFEVCADCSIYYIGASLNYFNSRYGSSANQVYNEDTKWIQIRSNKRNQFMSFFQDQYILPYSNYPDKKAENEILIHAFLWVTKKEGEGDAATVKEYGMFYYEPSEPVIWTTAKRMGLFTLTNVSDGSGYNFEEGSFTTGFHQFGLLLD